MKKMVLNLQLFAHVKAQGSTDNGRDSAGRRLGAKEAMDKWLLLETFFIVKEEQKFIQEQMLEWVKTTHCLLK